MVYNDYDCCGYATKNDLRCGDGRIIRRNAFKANDGQKVPLVWNHQHNEISNVLGHALLENRDDGVYAYCKFNDTENGQIAKNIVQHGDIVGFSIYANQLQQQGPNVIHGNIREVSLVLATANPGASIQSVIKHGAECDDEAVIFADEPVELYHSDEHTEDNSTLVHADDTSTNTTKKENTSMPEKEKTVQDVIDSMTEEQKNVMNYLVGAALEGDLDDEEKEGGEEMKHNAFDTDYNEQGGCLSHSDQVQIINMAKSSSCGSLQDAMSAYFEDDEALAHGINEIETLFPEYKDVRPGAPELIQRDQGWVGVVMNKTHKSPISRIRTRQADVRGADLRAFGYKKGAKKNVPGNIKLLKRTTDPQTVYRKDALNRDDIIDITDFDVVAYQYGIMRQNLNEEIATAIMIGDGREDGDENKISEEHIRPIWTDDDLYTIHTDVDVNATKAELQGTNTGANFGENYVYAEAIITAALYSREQYKGSGTPDFYCTPHLLNVMLLARDLNGRRIYESKSDLAAALNVNEIYTAEQFEGRVRITKVGAKKKKLLGIFVNLADYYIGSTRGGEITKFNQFDIDFNQEKYLIETRISGALTRVFSAIALEEPVTESGSSEVSG